MGLLPLLFSASIVPEIVNICKFNPWDLPGDWEQDRYFFSKKEAKYGNAQRSNRVSDNGYWKATGFDKQITRCCNNNPNSRRREIITGMKKTLVFYKGKPMHGEATTRTNWIMHEYRLVHSSCTPKTNSNDKGSWIQMGNWVLCHVFLNKRSRKVGNEDVKPISSGLTPQKGLLHHGLTIRNDGMHVIHDKVVINYYYYDDDETTWLKKVILISSELIVNQSLQHLRRRFLATVEIIPAEEQGRKRHHFPS
ncbi:NAC domain-containing protein [Artemisia annua]|uniref:NAC domain-containing protein n=1 Tax=Artemisia annua TaxID=35608 RepID=A0A2U1ME84_ARTAN|nr:NAC domain-containing protein [Artemisia annua]